MDKKSVFAMFIAFLSLLAAVSMIWLVVAVYQTTNKISDLQNDNIVRSVETKAAAQAAEQSAADSAETLRIIEDCLNPEGACAQENNAETAAIIEAFNKSVTQASIYAAACADRVNPQTAEEIEACVFRLLAEE